MIRCLLAPRPVPLQQGPSPWLSVTGATPVSPRLKLKSVPFPLRSEVRVQFPRGLRGSWREAACPLCPSPVLPPDPGSSGRCGPEALEQQGPMRMGGLLLAGLTPWPG